MSIAHKSGRETLFLYACLCLDSRISLSEMDQKIELVGKINYGDSYLEYRFPRFNEFRLPATLHDGAVIVRAHSGKGPG